MSWFSKAGIYEKLALYCIDKSPLVVDKEKLKSKDGKIIVTDARINHQLANENSSKQDSSKNEGFNEIDGIIRHIDLEITSNGLTINVEDCEVIVHDTNQSSLDVNQITEDLMKSVHLLKNNINSFNYKEFGDSLYASSSETETSTDSIDMKKEPLYNDEIITSEEKDLEDGSDAQNSSGSLMDSFKNKIIDMILSNFHIHFNDVRVILVNSEIVVNIESFEAKSSGSERYIDMFGVGVEKYYEDELAKPSPVDNSIFVSARSSFTNSKAQNLKDGLSDENKYLLYLEEISLYFISSNDPSKLIPEEIMISDFTVKYDDMNMSFSSFNVFVKKNIHRFIFKTDELIINITGSKLDSKGYKLELNNIEYSNYMKTKLKNGESFASDTFEIEKIKVFHKNLNLSSKKSSSSHKALSVVIKNTYHENEKTLGFDFKLVALELVSKTYRINSGIILKIPLITGSWKNSKLTGVIKTFSFSLIESFKTLNILNNFLIVDNVKLNYEEACLSIYLDVLASSDYFIPENFDNDTKSHNGSIGIEEKSVNIKLKKKFLKGLIENVLLEKEKDGSIEGLTRKSKDSNSKFNLRLLIKTFKFKMHDGFNFNHTRDTIALKLKQQSDSDGDEILFSSIYIPRTQKQNNNTDNEYLETQNFNILPEFNLQKVQRHSGEITATDLSVGFEVINQVVQGKLQLRCKDLDVIDNLKSSNFNKFLTSHKSPELDNSFLKEKRNLLSFDLEIVKPDERLLATEMRMKLQLEPIRMHINEEYVDFLMRFFTFRDERFELVDEYPETAFIQKLEIMGINISVDFKSGVKKSKEEKDVNEEESVRSKFLSTLKSLIHLVMYGIDDFGDISKIIQSRWIMDVINSQRIALMSGVLPLNSALNITTAFKNLIEQPFVQSSTMDVSRSFQNNLIDLGKISGKEFLKFGANISQHTQRWLESTEALLSDSNVNIKDKYIDVKKEYYANEDNIIGQRGRQRDTEQIHNTPAFDDNLPLRIEEKPTNFKEGMNLAFSSLESNLEDAYKTVSNTSKDLQRTRNKKDASKMIMNNLGITLLKPLIGATGALNNSFQGLQGEFQDDEVNSYTRLYLKEKYK
ncbi:hypothetical protein ACO0OL_001270 [Hanseniaspora opuntiae]